MSRNILFQKLFVRKGLNFLVIAAAAVLAVGITDELRAEEPEAIENPEYIQTFEVPEVLDGEGNPEIIGTNYREWFLMHFEVKQETCVGYIDIPEESLEGVVNVSLVKSPNGTIAKGGVGPFRPLAEDVIAEGVSIGNGRFEFAQNEILEPDFAGTGKETYAVWVQFYPDPTYPRRNYAWGDDEGVTSSKGLSIGSLQSWDGFGSAIHVVPAAFSLGEMQEGNLVPAAPTLTPDTDTGFSNTDGITNNRSPKITGTWQIGDAVNIYIDGVLQSATSVTLDGQSISTPELPDGAYSITTTVNGGTQSSPVVVTVDTIAPSAPAAPVLAEASDTGTPGDRNTVDVSPAFEGDPESNGLLHLYVNGEIVASVVTSGAVTLVEPNDSLQPNPFAASTATFAHEDAAGNMSPMSGGTSFKIVALPVEVALLENEVVISLPETAPGETYRLLSSPDLKTWAETGLAVEGDGAEKSFADSLDQGSGAEQARSKFYRVVY